ncbi:hypothetical protein pb186bvf_020169 [Paramecium bursaria]
MNDIYPNHYQKMIFFEMNNKSHLVPQNQNYFITHYKNIILLIFQQNTFFLIDFINK